MIEITHAVVVTRPGYETVRLGPYRNRHAAEVAALVFRESMDDTVHPEGTAVTVAPFDPQQPHEDPRVPTDPGLLADLIANVGAVGDELEACFPDLYTRLCADAGREVAAKAWRLACDRLDEPVNG